MLYQLSYTPKARVACYVSPEAKSRGIAPATGKGPSPLATA